MNSLPDFDWEHFQGGCELHAHSTASDGRLSPGELVKAAAAAELKLLALTDHDTIGGIAEAREAALLHGLAVLPGVELSTSWNQHSAHLLGYFPPDWNLKAPAAVEFAQWLEHTRDLRRQRNRLIGEKMRAQGIPINVEELAEERRKHGGQLLGRPHLAHWLVSHGHAISMADAFARFLTPGTPTYVRLEGVPTSEAIGRIHLAGGLASLAHPSRLKFDWRPILPELAAAGLDGLEVFYPHHDAHLVRELGELARLHHLLPTGGSDFHGRPEDKLGTISLAPELLRAWPNHWKSPHEPIGTGRVHREN